MECLSEDTVLEFVSGQASPDRIAEVDIHLAECAGCRGVVADVAQDLSNPMRFGRYEVTRTVGLGGMGVVYEAHDPHLHRRVALKVMRADLSIGDEAQARALREARAMAQVSHPNVVAVYDVGVVDRQIFIAMEYVDGETLKSFMRTKPPWRQVFERLLQAGEGLVAAHDVGLVHRDFKPENVLLGKDGRVRVTDFGLARLASSRDPEAPSVSGRTRDVLTTLTRTNLFVGTPAYMSPEQFAGKPSDPRSDQFAFCVVLYETLYGRRPFRGADLQELAANAISETVEIPRLKADEPAAMREALLKGLDRDPAKRHATMHALLAALRASDRPSARRSKWIYAGVAGAVLVPLVALAALASSKTRATPTETSSSAPSVIVAMSSAPSATNDPVASVAPPTTSWTTQATKPVVHARPTHPRAQPSVYSPLKPFEESKP